MFIKLETKIWSDYYFSFMKLIVTTFLVYKVKKSLLKSGKVKEAVYQNMPKPWGIYAQSLGRRCPSRGDTMPKRWGKPCSFVYLWINSM